MGQVERPSSVFCVSWSPDGNWIATGACAGGLSLWAVDQTTNEPRIDRKPTHERYLGPHKVTGLAWSAHSRRLAAATGALVDVWELPGMACNVR